MVVYGLLWVLWSPVPPKRIIWPVIPSSRFEFFKISKIFKIFQPQTTSKSSEIRDISGTIGSNPAQSGWFWHKNGRLEMFLTYEIFILSGNFEFLRKFCRFRKFFYRKFSWSFEIFLKFCFHKMSHYWVNMSGPESVFHFYKFKNISSIICSICSILWSHLNKSFYF